MNPQPEARQPIPWWVVPSLAAGVLLIFAGALVASFIWADSTLRTTMATGALALATSAGGFYWGSSASSQKKDETIAQAAQDLAQSKPAGKP